MFLKIKPTLQVQQGFQRTDALSSVKLKRMVNANEFKRFQAPPVLRVSDKAFGIGRRMPIVAKY